MTGAEQYRNRVRGAGREPLCEDFDDYTMRTDANPYREDNAMDLQLKNRHALIIGSTAGIGFAIARGLAGEGAQVTITSALSSATNGAAMRADGGVVNQIM